jgi:hypothetical protein
MALTILIRAQLNAIPVLADGCFTKQNYGVNTNTTLSVNTPRGVLGGSVAAVSAGNDYTVVPGHVDLQPVGLFVNDAAGAAFENSPAVASGKVTVIKGQASVEVDVYETKNAANSADLTYAVGNLLYSSAQGFLTNEKPSDVGGSIDTVIGLCTKAPTTASPTLGLDERI